MSQAHKTVSIAEQGLQQWRLYLVLLVLLVVSIALVWHLAMLQVVPGEEKGFEFLQVQGDARTVRIEELSAHRGVITDRNGEPLAVSSPVVSIWANPQVLLQTPEVWGDLAKVLGVSDGALADKLRRYRNKEFVYLQRHLPPQDAEKILQKKIAGVLSLEI